MSKDVEKKVDNLLSIKNLEKFNIAKRQDPFINPSEGLPWYGRLLILILILTVVCSVVFYVITPSEAFTYYMAEGLKAAAGVALYFIKIFGVALVLVIFTLTMKPILPTFEYESIYEDTPEKYYYWPSSYKIIKGMGVVKTFRGQTIHFPLSNTLKKGKRIYQVKPVIEDIDVDGIMTLDSKDKEVETMKFLIEDNRRYKERAHSLTKQISQLDSQDAKLERIKSRYFEKSYEG